ncbi:DUF4915 domain-containing protein [Rossellomorea yichunensis]|uniref:DUF4915 domain-containing protein n=1 Tax=Rossellomorea yichunensis TaxID=3077331 RepID=UPI0028DEAA7C|nr:DUF4915 domain-containing protein [Rossellomorea sp. YC4-1]MDT9027471.1 DUF4915 domain-containing protein [Rossellomorea sp. YC4-1]
MRQTTQKIEFPQKIKLLVSCCNAQGGLFEVECFGEKVQIEKKIDHTVHGVRGVAKIASGGYFIADSSRSLGIYDEKFQKVADYTPGEMDYHGVEIYNNHAYVVETNRNRIGIYTLDSIKRVGEIKISPVNHMNDLAFHHGELYISMFAEENWPKSSRPGVINRYSIDGKKRETYIDSLHQPHSVVFYKDKIYYCSSPNRIVKREKKVLFQSNEGYLRGLAVNDSYIFIGQSQSRHDQYRSVRCGFYIYDIKSEDYEFIPLPATEVYRILLIE